MTVSTKNARGRNALQPALDKARRDLQQLDLHAVAARSGARVVRQGDGEGLELSYWGQELRLAWPSGEVLSCARPLFPAAHLVVLHYLINADGAPLEDRWLAFRELPDGRVYDSAFRSRSCLPLAHAFGARPEAFAAAAQRLGGQRLTFGDVSFMFQVLPQVRVAVILYAGDDEFPADGNMLFDASLRHYLPIEDVAVLGGLVAAELLRA
ncbi:MAG TPA: DUF3786 domain-containing protein [Anaerolineae bacterium]|nr:DUF3786 domain-containing protein [Anaerolineae bacterium]HOR00491.1 DUF3786 domain-containing protein [Anaerolineae bacterium]HPL28105.1 DUF3786 domain-containing protein [Anaerolineae bacterium]